jgi:Flp pilus assembly protein TadG
MKISALKHSLGDATGTEIAEAALVLPIMFLILLGIYYFGLALSTYETINHAATEAARVAAMETCATCARPSSNTALAGNAAQAVLQAAGLNPASATPPGAETVTACGINTTPTCNDPGSPHMCVYYFVSLNSTGQLNACGVYVSMQYPYTFNLPLASLNQPLMLKARVQLKSEE